MGSHEEPVSDEIGHVPFRDNSDQAAETLSNNRESSIIATTDGETWQYPSEAQFSRALARRGKDVPPEAVPDMLAIHNALNDAVWARIAAAERLLRPHCAACPAPALEAFCGRPDALSPTALWHVAVRGGRPPFDRHDWRVRTACGDTRRYVIDYYGTGLGEAVFSVHIRPAVDSWRDVVDRVRLWYLRRFRGVDPFA